MPTLVKYATRSISARRVLTAAAMLLSATTIASAQESFAPGEAYTTRFSGTVEFDVGDGTMAKIIDENGVVGSAIDVRNPGFPADGRHWVDEPQHLQVTAGEVGQVFGVAIDNDDTANIYLTATSAFGPVCPQPVIAQ